MNCVTIGSSGTANRMEVGTPSMEYIEDDELVEVTPDVIRLRKILLSEHDRKRQSRQK